MLWVILLSPSRKQETRSTIALRADQEGLQISGSHDSSWDEILPDKSSLLSLKRDTQHLKETKVVGE